MTKGKKREKKKRRVELGKLERWRQRGTDLMSLCDSPGTSVWIGFEA